MHNYPQKSLARARYMAKNPQIVADMYRLSAEGNSFADVVHDLNILHACDEFHITEHAVRNTFHRNPPFNNSAMFSLVSEELRKEVEAKFRGSKKKKTTVAYPPKRTPVSSDVREEALNTLNKAHLAYEKALRNAMSLGMCRDTLESLVAMTTDMVLKLEEDDGKAS